MSKLTLTGLALPLFLLFASPPASAPKAFGAIEGDSRKSGQAGTLQKMIVENGSVTMDLDLNRLNGIGFALERPTTLQFAVAANSFFSNSGFQRSVARSRAGIDGLGPSRSQRSRLQFTRRAARVSQAARNRKTSFAAKVSIWPCATARPDSPFSMSKETNTTTTQMRSRSASPADGCWSPKNSRSPLAARQTPAQSLGEISIGATMQPIEITSARRKRRCEIRDTARAAPTWRWDRSRPRRHHRRADRPGSN